MDIFMADAARRLGDDDVLARVDALLDWWAFLPILKRGLGRSGVEPQGYDPLVLFEVLTLGSMAWVERPEAGARFFGSELSRSFHSHVSPRKCVWISCCFAGCHQVPRFLMKPRIAAFI